MINIVRVVSYASRFGAGVSFSRANIFGRLVRLYKLISTHPVLFDSLFLIIFTRLLWIHGVLRVWGFVFPCWCWFVDFYTEGKSLLRVMAKGACICIKRNSLAWSFGRVVAYHIQFVVPCNRNVRVRLCRAMKTVKIRL